MNTNGFTQDESSEARQDFIEKNLYARMFDEELVSAADRFELWEWEMRELSRAGQISPYFEGQLEIRGRSHTLTLRILLKIEIESKTVDATGEVATLPPSAKCAFYIVTGQVDLAEPFFIDGGGECEHFPISGKHFYFPVVLYQRGIQNMINFALIPLPITKNAPLQYQMADTNVWIVDSKFHWVPMDKESYDKAVTHALDRARNNK